MGHDARGSRRLLSGVSALCAAVRLSRLHAYTRGSLRHQASSSAATAERPPLYELSGSFRRQIVGLKVRPPWFTFRARYKRARNVNHYGNGLVRSALVTSWVVSGARKST